jgi:uncharacterized coiled-coil protein SlyX
MAKSHRPASPSDSQYEDCCATVEALTKAVTGLHSTIAWQTKRINKMQEIIDELTGKFGRILTDQQGE